MENAGYAAQRVVTVSSEYDRSSKVPSAEAPRAAGGSFPRRARSRARRSAATSMCHSRNPPTPRRTPKSVTTARRPGKSPTPGLWKSSASPLLTRNVYQQGSREHLWRRPRSALWRARLGAGVRPSGSGSGSGAPGSNVSGTGTGTSTGTGGPPPTLKPKPWSHTLCKTTYKKWAKRAQARDAQAEKRRPAASWVTCLPAVAAEIAARSAAAAAQSDMG